MSDQLVVIEKKNVMDIFSLEGGLDPVINAIIEEVRSHKPDTETAKGRASIKSLANKVAKSKVYLDNLGKDLTADWKSKAKVVDSSRRKVRDTLSDLKDEVRKPLTDWEEAEAESLRIFEEEAAILKLREEVENDHEMGLLLNEKRDRDIAEAAKEKAEAEAEQQRLAGIAQKERDEKIAKDAVKKAELEKVAIQEKAESDARLAKEREEQAKIDADNAAKKALADIEQAKEQATQREIERQKRVEAEETAKQEKLEANKRHVGKIRKEAKIDLMEVLGIEEKLAVSIVLAINKGDIANLCINY